MPYTIHWDDKHNRLCLPALKQIRFVPGIAIGGVVKDEAGSSPAGARITVNAPPKETEGTHYITPRRDHDRCRGPLVREDTPADLVRVKVAVQAPRFLKAAARPLRNLDAC